MRQEFAVHMLNQEGKQKAESLAFIFDKTLGVLEELCTGDKRCLALARTKMEEACFFAKKAMATDPKNCLP
jgi:hypothetical protein